MQVKWNNAPQISLTFLEPFYVVRRDVTEENPFPWDSGRIRMLKRSAVDPDFTAQGKNKSKSKQDEINIPSLIWILILIYILLSTGLRIWQCQTPRLDQE